MEGTWKPGELVRCTLREEKNMFFLGGGNVLKGLDNQAVLCQLFWGNTSFRGWMNLVQA